MRLLTGIGASTPVSTIGGIYADIYSTPKARGRAITWFMAATTWGPLVGPIISGYVATVSWRWTYWCALIIAGATFPFVLCLPETYGPILLKRKAKKLRVETGKSNIVAPIELENQSWQEFFTVVLTRPVRMFLFEWIVLFSCLYLSVAYAIFYSMCWVSDSRLVADSARSVFPGLPDHFWRHVWLQCWAARTCLLANWDRGHVRWRHLSLL